MSVSSDNALVPRILIRYAHLLDSFLLGASQSACLQVSPDLYPSLGSVSPRKRPVTERFKVAHISTIIFQVASLDIFYVLLDLLTLYLW